MEFLTKFESFIRSFRTILPPRDRLGVSWRLWTCGKWIEKARCGKKFQPGLLLVWLQRVYVGRSLCRTRRHFSATSLVARHQRRCGGRYFERGSSHYAPLGWTRWKGHLFCIGKQQVSWIRYVLDRQLFF